MLPIVMVVGSVAAGGDGKSAHGMIVPPFIFANRDFLGNADHPIHFDFYFLNFIIFSYRHFALRSMIVVSIFP